MYLGNRVIQIANGKTIARDVSQIIPVIGDGYEAWTMEEGNEDFDKLIEWHRLDDQITIGDASKETTKSNDNCLGGAESS